MGQEIGRSQFSSADFEAFQQRLVAETVLLGRFIQEGRFSQRGPVTGFELEAWLVDDAMRPMPINQRFLEAFEDDSAGPELARFNVEFNLPTLEVNGKVLSGMRDALERIWEKGWATAESVHAHLVAIGSLPTVGEDQLHLGNISELKRYRALNEQILAGRGHQPLRLEITGRETLKSCHDDVMLEAATTSFQIHLQVPGTELRRYFNASLLASAPLVGIAGNSPFLFGKDLWAETRIPLFEQAVAIGGPDGAASGPLRRVSFGSGYMRGDASELFQENLEHFPVLLPIVMDKPPECFAHLRLHNGTIWRWNRPLVGFDDDGTAHLRIEQRVLAAGPTIMDMVANTALFYGLVEGFADAGFAEEIPFAWARDNFYQSARHGLDGVFQWTGGSRKRLRAAVLDLLLPMARSGLSKLGLADDDCFDYLSIIEARVESGQTGSQWQRQFLARHPGAFAEMLGEYWRLQRSGAPVHQWPI